MDELNLLTGQTAIVTARVRTAGVVHRIGPAQFRELMAQDGDVADIVLRALLARRETLRRGEGAEVVPVPCAQGQPEVVGETSVPGVFAVGDVRSGSMKRVAAAVGEGASAIRSVHLALSPVG